MLRKSKLKLLWKSLENGLIMGTGTGTILGGSLLVLQMSILGSKLVIDTLLAGCSLLNKDCIKQHPPNFSHYQTQIGILTSLLSVAGGFSVGIIKTLINNYLGLENDMHINDTYELFFNVYPVYPQNIKEEEKLKIKKCPIIWVKSEQPVFVSFKKGKDWYCHAYDYTALKTWFEERLSSGNDTTLDLASGINLLDPEVTNVCISTSILQHILDRKITIPELEEAPTVTLRI